GHPNHKFLRYDCTEQFDDLKIIFDCATANGSSAISLGDTTDARVFMVGNSQVQDNLNFEDINDDVYAQQPSPENGVKRRVEKLVSIKRSRSDASSSAVEINSNQSDAMVFYHESTFEEVEQMYDEMQANQMEEDESELDILLVMLNNIATTYVRSDNRIQRPVRRPITNIGYDYIQNALKEDPEHFRSLYRMYPSSFEKFCDLIRMKTGLRDTRNICIEEMVTRFLLIVGQGSKYGYTRDIFKRSKFTISENFHKVLRALNTLAHALQENRGILMAEIVRNSSE
ncbi:hypothetical protein F2Q69_00048562, partial [Brassica cretica]